MKTRSNGNATRSAVMAAIQSGATNRGAIQRRAGVSMSRLEVVLRSLVDRGEVVRAQYGVYVAGRKAA